QRRGLTLKTHQETLNLPIPAVGHPTEIHFAEGDVVFLTVKSQDTERALRDLQEGGSCGLPVVCCQNGVDNERMALRRCARVYGMAVWSAATYLEPGIVLNESMPVGGVLIIGRYPRDIDALATQIAVDLGGCGFSSWTVPRIMRWKYSKLLRNIFNALQAICGLQRRVMEARAPDLVKALQEEALACYRAAGIDFVSEEEILQKVRSRYRSAEIDGHPRRGSSSWQSLARGLPSIEVDFLNGEIVLLGALHGVPTPCNRLLQEVANRVVLEGKPPGSMKIEELEQMLRAGGAI
ncbi:MAG: ketopantoate reductase family protein, partial [Deltaproteobacteria bacterium]